MISTKTCSKCGEEKPFSDFNKGKDKYGLHVWCRSCYKQWASEHYKKNKVAILETHHRYYIDNIDEIRKQQRKYSARPEVKEHKAEYVRKNKEHIREYHNEYRLKNKEYIRKKAKEYYHNNKEKNKQWHKKWRDSHKEQIKESSRRYLKENRAKVNASRLNRLHVDQTYKMKEQTRNMIRYALRSKGHRKKSHTADILGCDLDFFCKYLLSTWENNYGKPWNGEPYHIDHITPLVTAKSEEDIVKLCHYSNLQMLTPEDNMKKGISM